MSEPHVVFSEQFGAALARSRDCRCESKDWGVFCANPAPGQCTGTKHGRFLLEFKTVCCGRPLACLKGCPRCLPNEEQAKAVCRVAGLKGKVHAFWVDLDRDADVCVCD